MSTSALSPPQSSIFSPSSSAPLPASRGNPVALRIYKSIGASFDDPASYQALSIASDFYASSSSSTKGKSPEEGLDENADSEDLPLRRSLRGQSASMARKYLKKDVE